MDIEIPTTAAAAMAAVAYAATHIHDHCYICGRLHEQRSSAPRTCENDACVLAELTLLPFMDLHSELAGKGREVTVGLSEQIPQMHAPYISSLFFRHCFSTLPSLLALIQRNAKRCWPLHPLITYGPGAHPVYICWMMASPLL